MLYHPQTIFARTTKGIREARNTKLPRELSRLFAAVDGKAAVSELISISGVPVGHCHLALEQLETEGYIRVFTSPNMPSGAGSPSATQSIPLATAGVATADSSDELDFTTAEGIATVTSEAAQRDLAESAARSRAEAAAQAAAKADIRLEAEKRARVIAEARVKAETEARIRAEVEATARSEARTQMEAELRKIQEAERASRDIEIAKARNDADAQTREVVRTLQEEARQAKAEAEAIAASERAARDEIEARAQAQVREVQAQSARAQAESAAQMAAEKKARAEAAAQAAAEMLVHAQEERQAIQELALTVAAERKAREEAEQEAARASREMEIAKARADAEAQTREMVRKLQEEARQAKAEAEAIAASERAARDEIEARAQAQVREVQAQSARAQAESAAQMAAEKKARAEAAAQAAAEMLMHAQEERQSIQELALTVAVERKAREEAQAVQRMMQQQQSRVDAEADIGARVALELKAREDAERAEDARYRAEAEARALASAELQARAADAKAAQAPRAPGRKTNWLRVGVGGAAVTVVVALGLLQLMPLSSYVPAVQVLMTQRLGLPVAISGMRYELLPTPQLALERISVGKLAEIKADNIFVPLGPLGLLSGSKNFDTILVKGVTLDTDALGALAGWLRAPAGEPALHISRIKFSEVKLAAPGMEIPRFEVDATLGRRGDVSKLAIDVEKARFDITPKGSAWQVQLSASGWKPFIGPAITFDELEATAMVDGSGATVTAIKGRVGGGSLSATFKATWGGTIQVTGDLKLENGRTDQLLPLFTRNFSASGTLDLTANYRLHGAHLKTLFDAVRLEGVFAIARGELNNVDIVRALQASRAAGQRGGKTRFDSLSGALQISGNSYRYRQLQLNSGPVNASGTVDVNEGALSGNINAELGSKGVVVARGTLTAGGTVGDPVLR